ncbi:kinase-like domain-containing protein [Chaetomium strumarium]|uniref:Kinase-like domain-containing protein n=1 Tax=Chaetomium strumarium TaxID=1170767 RepID=A0AAJ0H398_9PEZI|nr:kinase-like domain-containing protein [Chaetomium strumarium]
MPDERALELAARFSAPIRWVHVWRAIERRQSRPYVASVFAAISSAVLCIFARAWEPFSRALWYLWRLLPSRVRIRAYYELYRAGRFVYGPTDAKVQRLPFNLFIKYCNASSNGPLTNEYGALQLIRRHSDLAVPRPLDLVSDSKRSYMVTSRIPGYTMGEVFSMLTDEQLHDLASDLNRFLSKLRTIPKELRPGTAPATAVTGATGGGCHHVRMELIFGSRTPYGPFATEEDFHDFILTRRPPAPDEIQRGGHDIVMTHGDLSRRNILVHEDGRLAGVVDWEHAGWYPTYWEYTSFLYGLDSLHTPQRLADMAGDVFQGFGDFEHELAVERRLWARIF